jgi:CPA2 family monovalent cation:H+ antiporter-2
VRTRHVCDVRNLLALGADEVIPEEFETLVRIFSCRVEKYALPKKEIDSLTEKIRSSGYRMFNRLTAPSARSASPGEDAEDFRIHTVFVAPGLFLCGKTVRDLDSWSHYHVGILGIRRGTTTSMSLTPEEKIHEGDALILYATDENLQTVLSFPSSGHPGPSG